MGVLRRKRPVEAAVPTRTRLEKLSGDDLYLLMESSLMDAQQRLAERRTAQPEARPALLDMLGTAIDSSYMCLQEMEIRG